MIVAILSVVLISAGAQVDRGPFADALPKRVPFTGWAHLKTQVLAVANDGSYLLATDGRYLQGYCLAKGYSLIPNDAQKVVFPEGSTRYRALGKYYGLAGGLAINVISSAAGTSILAVFSIDPAVDPAPTSLVEVGPFARIVTADLDGSTLRLTVAEAAQPAIMRFVEYGFRLAPRTATGVQTARRIKRMERHAGFKRKRSEAGRLTDDFGGGGGSVAADGDRAIFYHSVVSLSSGKATSYEPGTSAQMFFVGNDLYASRDAPAPGATRANNYDAGIYHFATGKWKKVSGDILQAISPNSRFAAVKRLPAEAGGVTQWLVVKLRS